MKRRNADCGKIRRPIKRNKITEGMYGSTTILYLKFLILWAIVITADFMFMFRFEFLWPFWLLLRSVHDSFKYKGLAFSVLFVCIAITSDLVCLFFIPVHWLLFAASTYVWVQYVWHTDKGICLPTIILWMLFVYLEAGIRWKDSRHMPHLDLCRPFAAHCIGYPVVTLGFGFKSYVGYRMRQRKQREVAKENEFYMQLLQQALPQDETTSTNNLLTSNSNCSNTDDIQQHNNTNGGISSNGQILNGSITVSQQLQNNNIDHNHHSNNNNSNHQSSNNISGIGTGGGGGDIQLNGGHNHQTSSHNAIHNNNNSSSLSSTTNHHHHNNNLNNLNNISSSNRNAQTNNSKLNNNNNSNLSNNLPTTSSTITTISSSATTITTTVHAQANGHIGNNNNNINNGGFTLNNPSSKNNRRSMDKDKNTKYETKNSSITSSPANNNNNNNNYHEISSAINHKDSKENTNNNWDANISTNNNNNNSSNNCISSNITSSVTSPISSSVTINLNKENNKSSYNFINQQHHVNGISHNNTAGENKKSQPNGNVIQYEVEEVIEPPERVKGRRNRSKRENASSKDNHQNNNNNNNNNSLHHNHHNSNHHSKDSHGNSDTSSISSTSSSAITISNIASQIVTKICDTCFRLEAEVKKYRTEISHMKQIENELRQKLDSNITTKSCLQAKQRECDDLDKRLHELTNTRQIDNMNLQNTERRLAEERRQRQSLEAQLNNEKKARKLAEEKATRPECSETCKQRKQQIDNELKQMRRELKLLEEAKQNAEQQARKYEQELRMFEAEIRNREAQQGTEVLMSALAAMQDKNSTLEKNLSAETRVKLDLFSALGEAKRQLEIKDSVLRNKEEEVLDLKAKIAQLLAVMPTDSLCLPSCSTGSSMLRINDTPPLQGPSSPMLTSLNTAHQQIMAANQVFRLTGSEIFQKDCENTNSGSNNNSIVSGSVVNNQGLQTGNGNSINNNNNNNNNNGQNLSCSNNGNSSNLDPNATAYTPKNSSMVVGGGSEA